MTSLPGEMSTAEVKSQKKRKRSDGDVEWAKSLSECHLDLMVSVKQLAMERVQSIREKSLTGLLTPAGLRAIGRLALDLIKEFPEKRSPRIGPHLPSGFYKCARVPYSSDWTLLPLKHQIFYSTPILADAMRGDRLRKHDEEKTCTHSKCKHLKSFSWK